ncbi:MAG: alpha-D-glucose phosphate-specific phosphoglucomutase [Gammaproteobacteria bacterium]|nr:alpha-D-glucose phosphate-specific phosphoglucomutase [Gammaproteobacteria bacterium]
MTLHARAGQPAGPEDLIDQAALERAYYELRPDPAITTQRVAFGTSGHRGSPLAGTFNEAHILTTTQAICDYRASQGIDGPLFLGRDTHAVSGPALATALEVLAANEVEVRIDAASGYTPTPVISHAILGWNRERSRRADGIVITPSHNPPADGGFKYNPPHGGPADTAITRWIEDRANALLEANWAGVRRMPIARARAADSVRGHDFIGTYVEDLDAVIDVEALRGAKLRVAIAPLGGAGVAYWGPIAERLDIALEIVDGGVDPTFAFMTLDWDGRIRMDCSSPHAMAKLVGLRDRYDLVCANDTDNDRHGIVTPAGLMNPNHYLAAAIAYLFRHRPGWNAGVAVGKTIVSSSIIDRVAADLGRPLVEVPVGFKWFVDGLHAGTLGFGGEESAGASFLRRDGRVWTTDKDGIIMDLLAIEMTARTGSDPAAIYSELTSRLGAPVYARIDAPATHAQKAVLGALEPEQIPTTMLDGSPIRALLTRAPGNDAAIGGIKVVSDTGWFAARPSGTEDVYKLYAESFRGPEQLARIQAEAQAIVARAFAAAGV